MTATHELVSLHLYPVKSLAGASPRTAVVEPWGLRGDRRWMLVDASGQVVTQREHARMALATAAPAAEGGIRLEGPGAEPLEVPVPDPGRGTVRVRIWRDEVEAVPAQEAASAWFGELLGAEVRLVHMDAPGSRRPIDPRYARPGETVSFADGFPLLLTTTASLDALNSLVAQGDFPEQGPLPMDRFRPSVVVAGGTAWEEDGWRRVRIGEVVLRVAKPCGRCVITTTDQRTGERGKEPLRTLALHRRIGDRLVFGQNLVPENGGTLRVGDPFTVLE
ncbi:MOSC domain-containing protein [Streptomyces thermolineatus]|uniref:MOSC domain-containing protein n=1 Tax=Streptomyces thermolineatus TaxID=44033 RepID=UPI00384B3A16